jgi:hypothetical protein
MGKSRVTFSVSILVFLGIGIGSMEVTTHLQSFSLHTSLFCPTIGNAARFFFELRIPKRTPILVALEAKTRKKIELLLILDSGSKNSSRIVLILAIGDQYIRRKRFSAQYVPS